VAGTHFNLRGLAGKELLHSSSSDRQCGRSATTATRTIEEVNRQCGGRRQFLLDNSPVQAQLALKLTEYIANIATMIG